jgi:hypothetical protein
MRTQRHVARVLALACATAAVSPAAAVAMPAPEPAASERAAGPVTPCPRGDQSLTNELAGFGCAQRTDPEAEAFIVAIGGASLLVIAGGVVLQASRRRHELGPDLQVQP